MRSVTIIALALALTACDRPSPVQTTPTPSATPRDRVDCGDGKLVPADYVCP